MRVNFISAEMNPRDIYTDKNDFKIRDNYRVNRITNVSFFFEPRRPRFSQKCTEHGGPVRRVKGYTVAGNHFCARRQRE